MLLPGVQVLVAFLLTAPFAARFDELDALEVRAYSVALLSGMLAIVFFVAPTAFHRLGRRQSRSKRLVWSIRMMRAGLIFMALAFETALFVLLGELFERAVSISVTVLVGVVGFSVWVVLPVVGLREHEHPGNK